MKLFSAVVAPTVFYGDGAWMMTKERERRLRTAQRKMLRRVLGSRRRIGQEENLQGRGGSGGDGEGRMIDDGGSRGPDAGKEIWVQWLKRTARSLEAQIKKGAATEGVTEQRRRKWRWAGRVATDTLGKWTLKALTWDPTLDARYNPRRRPGRPLTWWTDDIIEHITTQLYQHSTDQHSTNVAPRATAPQARENNNRWHWTDWAHDKELWKTLEDTRDRC